VWRVADLGCGVGISSDGYAQAGLTVVGFDTDPDVARYYPYEFHQADMLEVDLGGFDFVHVGPPCQHWSKMTRCRPDLAEMYPDLITPMRPRLMASGVPYVIENVEGSPLVDPVWLCGFMFGRLLYRHRGFEAGNGFSIPPLRHPEHTIRATKAGHWEEGTVMSIAGHIAPVAKARELMGVTRYVPRESLVEAAPAFMTAYIAAHAMTYLSRVAALWRWTRPATARSSCRLSCPARAA
jgi:DNA (cytosine-5)-methyltransferase 1